jgi:hypothetical protein
VKVDAARETSPRANAIGLPASEQMRFASSSARARMPSAIPRQSARRRKAERRRVDSKAAVAAEIAASTCSAPTIGTVPTMEPV